MARDKKNKVQDFKAIELNELEASEMTGLIGAAGVLADAAAVIGQRKAAWWEAVGKKYSLDLQNEGYAYDPFTRSVRRKGASR